MYNIDSVYVCVNIEYTYKLKNKFLEQHRLTPPKTMDKQEK